MGKVFWEILIFKTLKKMKIFQIEAEIEGEEKTISLKFYLKRKKSSKKTKKPTKEWQTILVFCPV
jgi:hypothetical protein